MKRCRNKIQSLEEELTNAHNEILKNNKKVQKFMEDGNSTIINQKEQIETCGEALAQIREELVS